MDSSKAALHAIKALTQFLVISLKFWFLFDSSSIGSTHPVMNGILSVTFITGWFNESLYLLHSTKSNKSWADMTPGRKVKPAPMLILKTATNLQGNRFLSSAGLLWTFKSLSVKSLIKRGFTDTSCEKTQNSFCPGCVLQKGLDLNLIGGAFILEINPN